MVIENIIYLVFLAGGGTNPKLNSNLTRVMEEGRSKDIPLATMNELLRKLVSFSSRQVVLKSSCCLVLCTVLVQILLVRCPV